MNHTFNNKHTKSTMDSSLISQDIIEKRKQQAPLLRSLQSETDKIISELETIERSDAFDSIPPKVSEYKKKIEDVRERIAHKLHLFEKGLINIAIAGTEKAGKTTFLQALTELPLPTAPERCTAVSCEIGWVPDGKDEGISIVYYTADELLDIINQEIEYLNGDDSDAHRAQVWKNPNEHPTLPKHTSLASFRSIRLPNTDALNQTAMLAFEPALAHLRAIQRALVQNESVLGQTRSSDLAYLKQYVAHESASEEQTLIRKVLVKKHLSKIENLCLFDTPGVDDPNPLAMLRTLRTLKEETDMLVILDRPKDSPSITESLSRFISRLETVSGKDYPIRERAIFLVNRYEAADPGGKCAAARRGEVLKREVFPEENLPEPCDVTNKESREKFWNVYLNERLRDTLPEQDAKAMRSLRDEVRELKTGVLTNVVRALESQAPPLPEKQREKVENDFDEWFDPEGDAKGFIQRLRSQFGELTEKPWEDQWLDNLVEKVKKISLKSREEIIKAIGENVTDAKIQEVKKGAVEDVSGIVFSKFQGLFSQYVEELTGAVVEIGPYILKRVEGVIRYALGKKVAAHLSNGGTLVDALLKELAEQANDDDVSKIAEGLADLVKVQDELGHISRYELRPALNLIDHLRWADARRMERLKEKTLDSFEHFEESKAKKKLMNFLKDAKTKLPSGSEQPAVFVEFLRGVFATSLYYVEEILRSNRKKFEALMEDYASDASLSLGTQQGAMSGWKRILRSHKDIIVPGYGELARNSERAALCRSIIIKLREALGD